MNGVRRVILVALLFAAVWAPGTAYAASCPYCGRTYGAAMPGDEARVNALRASHEASCPSRPGCFLRERERQILHAHCSFRPFSG